MLPRLLSYRLELPPSPRTYLRQRREAARRARRRRLVVSLLLIAAAVIGGVAAAIALTGSRRARPTAAAKSVPTAPPVRHTTAESTPSITPPQPGHARAIFQGPARPEVALTVDDGFCASCAARIISTLARTGAHATIFPNGRYSQSWDPLAPAIRHLVASGQLTVGNHTFNHNDPVAESSGAFRTDLSENETWIERTFGVSARPFFRPPYGAYNSDTLAVAGELGYTKVILWSGTVADSSPRSIGYILGAIRYWARPGAIILMHANYPATSVALPQILEILHQRGLRPVTIEQLLGP